MSLLFWQGSGILYNICYKLSEVFGILGSDYRLPCRFFNIFPGISCNGPAFLCYFSIFRKSSGLYSFRDFCCGGFRKHCQNQFQIVHVVSKIFFLQAFSFLYCRVVMPDHAREVSSVRIAYSLPFSTPRFCHSSVSSLRMRIAKRRWCTHSSEYPFFR